MVYFLKKKVLNFFSTLFCIGMIGLAILGGWRNFSPVPLWDMWDGTVNFFIQLQNGDYAVWWAQHNEHRIVLAKALFWLDYRFFSGSNLFLIIINYLLIVANCVTFLAFLKNLSVDEGVNKEGGLWSLKCFIVACLFLWTQYENMIIGFQSQFFLAQLLPLIALYLLAQATIFNSWSYFFLACLCGLLSVGTMANGVLAFPVMFLFSLLTQNNFKKRLLLFIFALIVPIIYFQGFVFPAQHGHLRDAILNHPFGLLKYILFYLGSPFHFLFLSKQFELLFGSIFMVLTVYATYRQVFGQKKSVYALALVMFLIYIIGSAFGTAGGRLCLGLEQAFSSRYTTPVLMAWVALLIIYFWEISLLQLKAKKNLFVSLFLLLGILMFTYQLHALRKSSEVATRAIAALALELGIKDVDYLTSIYPVPDRVFNVATSAKERSLSFFGHYPYKNLHRELGHVYPLRVLEKCSGALDSVTVINGVAGFVRVNGWLFDSNKRTAPRRISFVNNEDVIVGYALTGNFREDVKKKIDNRAGLSGFTGYIGKSVSGLHVTAVGENPSCMLGFDVPPEGKINS